MKLVSPLQAMVLCHFLETNQDKYNMADKNVIELGAGTGLVTIVASLLGIYSLSCSLSLCCPIHISAFNTNCHCIHPGGKVTSTDLPEVLGNLQYNVMRNTKDRCNYIPLVGFMLSSIVNHLKIY